MSAILFLQSRLPILPPINYHNAAFFASPVVAANTESAGRTKQTMTDAPKYAVEMRGVTKRFGEVVANRNINLAVRDQSIHAIIGENGAGKSTAMNILYGFYNPDEGEILIDGEVCAIKSPSDAIRLGLGMVHQHFMLVEPLTVTDNIVLGAEPTKGLAIDYRRARARVKEISEQYGLRINPDARVGDLSVGQQQRVEILKTLYRGARILILDEPTAVLTPQEVTEMFAILRSLREQGKTIIIITHKLAEVLALSDNITVMRDGEVVGNLPTSEATAEGLARLMVGREVLLRVKKDDAKPREAVLTVKDLTFSDADHGAVLDGVSFAVRGGETLGIAGIEGNGQTELIEILAGLRDASAGEIMFQGQCLKVIDRSILAESFSARWKKARTFTEYLKVLLAAFSTLKNLISLLTGFGLGVAASFYEVWRDPRARIFKKYGIAHIPEDRHRRGLLLGFDLAANSILGVHRDPPFSGRVLLNQSIINKRATALVKEYDVRPPDITLPARALSGGNQQKLIVAREFDIKPKLLLVSQPTRGVDIGATEFIHRKLIDLRDAGAAVLLVSAELDEVLSLSDRVIVFYEGRIVGEVDPKTVSEAEIGLMMTGGKTGDRGQGAGDREDAGASDPLPPAPGPQ